MEYESFISCIVKSSRHTREVYDSSISVIAEKCGITRPEADVLLFLYNNPEFNTASDIAYYRGLSKAYVSKAVEPLIKRGMISIQSDSTDRRRQLISITGGLDTAKMLRKGQEEFIAKIVRGIPDSDVEKFMEVTKAMAQNALT